MGNLHERASKKFYKSINKFDPSKKWVRYLGPKSFNELPEIYHDADIGLFASSCENMPNIIIEKMASGLPILCSKNSPMPEIIGEGAIYFDPENITSISDSILMVLKSSELRSSISKKYIIYLKNFAGMTVVIKLLSIYPI